MFSSQDRSLNITLTSGGGKWCHFRQIKYRPISPLFLQDQRRLTLGLLQYGSRSINAVEALEYSSNTYMVQIALKMIGANLYTPNMTCAIMDPRKTPFLLLYTVLNAQRIDLPMNRPVLSPKEHSESKNYLTTPWPV